MATVTPPRTSLNLEQDRSRIKSPLARLRKYIHTYVSLEGAVLVGLFLALWFWIGMILDYGFFKLFTVDWVQELPWSFRLVVLLALIGAIVAIAVLKVVTRLITDFSDAAVALVLERRFPGQLGDRLITAVELSDPTRKAEIDAIGYSQAMVQQTIHEAADRVDQVPVKEVFDWNRLFSLAALFGVLTLAFYLLVGAGFCLARAVGGGGPAASGYGDLNEVSTIWVERNLLLRNTIWPRRAYLEIVDFPDPLRIPRESAPPTLRVRAWKYVVADMEAEEGWRLLSWADLQKRTDLAGDVPDLPADWKGRDKAGISVDEVELKLAVFPVRTSLPGGSLPAKWCVASAQNDSGWRPLMWSDLTKEKLGGLEVPGLPGDWDPKALPALIAASAGMMRAGALAAGPGLLVGPKYISLSVDEVEKQLEKAEKESAKRQAKQGLDSVRMVFATLKRYSDVREALDRLDERLADRTLRRSVRKLIVPENVTLVFKSNRTTNTNTMTRVADNEYTGNFGELKESVTFTVRGEDYITSRRTITVVDRPRLERLESEEERPAYLYYRPAKDGAPADLRGKRQLFEPVPMSVSGEVTTIDVPAGTTLTLSGTVTKDITRVALFVEKKDQRDLVVEEPILKDGRTFQARIPDIRREQRFTFRFTDSDDVTAERKVVINPRDDVSPRVREFNPDEVIRRAKEGYIVGVGCRIPFKAKVRDDHGLARVRYACRIIPADFLSEQKVRSLFGVAAVPMMAPSTTAQLQGAAYLIALNREIAASAKEEATAEQLLEMPGFHQAIEGNILSDSRREFLEIGTVLSLLKEKQREPYRKLLNDFTIKPDPWTNNDEDATNPNRWVRAQDQRAPLACDLPLWQLYFRDREGKERPLKDPDDTKPQKRFLIEVRLLAEDTYLDGEIDAKTNQPIPHVSPSGETFTFVVVPENELLSKIAEEEETRYRDLQKAFKPLPENLSRLRDIHFAVSATGVQATDLTAFVARCDQLAEILKTSHQDTKGVYQAYERILRELRVNQLREDVISKVYRTIYKPLAEVSETQFDRTYSAVIALRRALDNQEQTAAARSEASRKPAEDARKQLNDLVEKINGILSAMEGLAKINELIAELVRIERQVEDIGPVLKKVWLDRIRKELDKDK
jgi:hypothetical protein